ncbi:MAG: DJ-1/PfpI family protein, partial [Phycisphaerae bacterium]
MKPFAYRLAAGILCALLIVLLTTAPAGAEDSADSRVLILLAKGYNSGEFWMPYLVLRGAGYDVDIAGPAKGTIEAGRRKRDQDTTANLALDEVKVGRYVGLVIPGGYSPGNLEKHKEALAICEAFNEARKPISAICHGPRLLMRAGIMKDRVGTCLASVKNELAEDWEKGGYGKYVDRSVVVHGNILTSRYPGDLTPFCRTMLRKLEAAGGRKAPHGRHKAIVIGEGFDGHRRWIFNQVLGVLGIEAKVISPQGVDKLAGEDGFKASEYAVVAVVGTEKADTLARSDGMAKIVDAIDAHRDGGVLLDSRLRALPRTVDEDERITVTADSDGDWLAAIVSTAGKVESLAEPAEEFVPMAAMVVQPGFDDATAAAVEAGLQKLGYRTTALAATDAWVTGKQGLPLHAIPVKDWKPPHGFMSAALMAKPVPVMAMVPAEKDKLEAATMEAIRTLRPIAEAVDASAAGMSEATAAVALRRGFDGRVVAAMKAILASGGHKVALVWHE